WRGAGEAKLLDFGLARWASDDGDREMTVAGTLGYLPPEARRGTAATPAFDLWALAVTVFEAVAGVNPFAAPQRRTRAHAFDDRAVSRFCSDHFSGDAALQAFFRRVFAVDPRMRCADARALLEELQQLR